MFFSVTVRGRLAGNVGNGFSRFSATVLASRVAACSVSLTALADVNFLFLAEMCCRILALHVSSACLRELVVVVAMPVPKQKRKHFKYVSDVVCYLLCFRVVSVPVANSKAASQFQSYLILSRSLPVILVR